MNLSPPLQFGVATRPHPHFTTNGDLALIHESPHSILIGVIDGLGHGKYAHKAAKTALNVIEENANDSFETIFRKTSKQCESTRGVVMTLMRFTNLPLQFTCAGIGNVFVKIFNHTETDSFTPNHGIVGYKTPLIKTKDYLWHPSMILLIYSDGIHFPTTFHFLPDWLEKPAEVLAKELVDQYAKQDDDATIIVVKEDINLVEHA